MKHCRRCHGDDLALLRKSVARRSGRHYTLYWYRCSICHEVNFSFDIYLEDAGATTPTRERQEETVSAEFGAEGTVLAH